MSIMIDEVLFLRHGRTAYNLGRRLQGQIDIPLDIVGRWQVDQSAYELARRYYWAKITNQAQHPETLQQPTGPDAHLADPNEITQAPASKRQMTIISSDLFRAQQTARAFANLLGLPVEYDSRLRERSFGEWEGMTREEIREANASDYDSWRSHTGGELNHGVESRTHTGQRGSRAVLDILDRHRENIVPTTLLIVGHGSWIVATIETLLGMDPDSLSNLGSMRNAFWSRMTPAGDAERPRWTLDEFNQGPAIAAFTDWENGPDDLRGPNMPQWKPIMQ